MNRASTTEKLVNSHTRSWLLNISSKLSDSFRVEITCGSTKTDDCMIRYYQPCVQPRTPHLVRGLRLLPSLLYSACSNNNSILCHINSSKIYPSLGRLFSGHLQKIKRPRHIYLPQTSPSSTIDLPSQLLSSKSSLDRLCTRIFLSRNAAFTNRKQRKSSTEAVRHAS
jgi:hypothetical protein